MASELEKLIIFVGDQPEIEATDVNAVMGQSRVGTIFDLARELGIPVKEKRITRDEVYVADELFFTGTAAEVTPIREVDGRVIGNGGRGPITERLQSLYFDQVHGRRSENAH